MVKIREGRIEDAPRCAEIAEAAYTPFVPLIGKRPMPMDQDFQDAVAQGQLWVAEGDALMGYIVAYPRGPAWLLENVAVDPAAHGKGVGRALIDHVEALARTAGAEAVELYTNALMEKNLQLYPALGYTEVDRAHQHGFDRVFYRKTV